VLFDEERRDLGDEFFGVSRVPIREALRQLQAEGLVQNIAHHRTIVAGLTLPQIIELVEMRAVLESYMLRKGAPKLDKASLDRIRRICDETDTLKDYGSRWVLKNWEFHRTLYAAADSQAMVDAVERIHLKIERYARDEIEPEMHAVDTGTGFRFEARSRLPDYAIPAGHAAAGTGCPGRFLPCLREAGQPLYCPRLTTPILALRGLTPYNESVGLLVRQAPGRKDHLAQQPRHRRSPAGHPRGRCHVGGSGFLGHRGPAQGGGL
jgi:hypothetical protein